MERMDDMSNKLDALFSEYRTAFPEVEGSTNFMPNLWQKIEARRVANTSVFRRWAQACVVATVALTLLIMVLLPKLQSDPVYTSTYVDVLDAAHSSDAAELLASVEFE
jgi:hypothetical protein